MKLLNFGSCNLDFVYSLDHIVAPGETEATVSSEIFPGGKGLNVAKTLNAFGHEAAAVCLTAVLTGFYDKFSAAQHHLKNMIFHSCLSACTSRRIYLFSFIRN